jgi:O-antigen biosynthesis protein WbqV
MNRLNLTTRQHLIIVHDLFATAVALALTLIMRFGGNELTGHLQIFPYFLPEYLIYAAVVYFVFGLHRNKWRFTSLPDLNIIVRATTVLAASLVVLDYILLTPTIYGHYFLGKITILLYWFLQIFCLAASRVGYRYFHYHRILQRARFTDAMPTIVLGRAADAEVLLRGIESGAVKKIRVAGVLSPSPADRGQSIRGIPVLGDTDDLEGIVADLAGRGTRVARLILTTSALAEDARPESMLIRARKLGLVVSKLPPLDQGGTAVQLAPVAVEDLLLRPTVAIDYGRLENFVTGKAIVVTGGGGSIGSEICHRIVTFGAARLLVIENSEPALHHVLEELTCRESKTELVGHIADIRDRDRIMTLLRAFKPDMAFHAAALKHVPLLERDWDEAIKTNVFGSVNVADAAVAAGASAMVMISTDKAIEPVSMLGATKRLAEMYCQALDTQFHKQRKEHPTRLISVRFGNVLASNGSVVPKFKAQIEAGGPITITHPDMVRYFMTIREACDLVITASSHALGGNNENDVSVYVLNMGQPVKIVELAERMIRLSGLEPGRDIELTYTGVRPGERLNEILFAQKEETRETGIVGILAARPTEPSLVTFRSWLAELDHALQTGDRSAIFKLFRDAMPEFRGAA